MKIHSLTTTALLAITMSLSLAETESDPTAVPPTTRARVESVQSRYDKTLKELTATFQSITTNPQLISSKETVDAIDQGDRALKSTKSACESILAALRTETKSIAAETSFSEDQKAELTAAVEALKTRCEEVSTKTSAAIKHLEGAYKAMGKWRKIHKSYLNLDGEIKAGEQLKASVDEFLKGLTTTPENSPPDFPKNGIGQ